MLYKEWLRKGIKLLIEAAIGLVIFVAVFVALIVLYLMLPGGN